MEGFNPIEWFAWLYGKLFHGHPIRGGFVVVGLWALVWALAGVGLWIRGVEKYNKENPKVQVAAEQGIPPATKVEPIPQPLTQPSTKKGKKGEPRKPAGNTNSLPNKPLVIRPPEQAQPPVVLNMKNSSGDAIVGNVFIHSGMATQDTTHDLIAGNTFDMGDYPLALEKLAGNPEEIEKWLILQHEKYVAICATLEAGVHNACLNDLDNFEKAVRAVANDKEATLALVAKMRKTGYPLP